MMLGRDTTLQERYVTPEMIVLEIHSEGLLCMSGSGYNDPLIEDNEWSDLLD